MTAASVDGRTVLAGPRHPWWKGDRVGYRGAHLRVVRERGRADRYRCVECGGRAHGWSLAPDADLRVFTFDPRGYEYATDPSLYQPRCGGCHYFRDALVRTGEVPAQLAAAAWLVGQLECVHDGSALASVLRTEAAAAGISHYQLSEGRRRYTDVQSVRVPGVRSVRRWCLAEVFEKEERADAG